MSNHHCQMESLLTTTVSYNAPPTSAKTLRLPEPFWPTQWHLHKPSKVVGLSSKGVPSSKTKKNISSQNTTSWWFQPIWEILVKLDPQVGVKIQNISNQHLDKIQYFDKKVVSSKDLLVQGHFGLHTLSFHWIRQHAVQPKALRGLNISNSFQQICIASYPGNSKAGGNVGDVAIAVLLWEHFDEHDSELTGIIYIYTYMISYRRSFVSTKNGQVFGDNRP